MQIDAYDQYWGAILIEEIEGQSFTMDMLVDNSNLQNSVTTPHTKKLWQSNMGYKNLISILGDISLKYTLTTPHFQNFWSSKKVPLSP